MKINSRWLVVHLLPLLLLGTLMALFERGASFPVLGAPAFLAVALVLVFGQPNIVVAYGIPKRAWAYATAAGFGVAYVFGVLTLALADAGGNESAGIVIGHIIFGVGLAGAQALTLRRAHLAASRWFCATSVTWIAGSILLATAYRLGWHPAGAWQLFPGFREFAGLATLLAFYGVVSAMALDRALKPLDFYSQSNL
jgi:hypothetical protein